MWRASDPRRPVLRYHSVATAGGRFWLFWMEIDLAKTGMTHHLPVYADYVVVIPEPMSGGRGRAGGGDAGVAASGSGGRGAAPAPRGGLWAANGVRRCRGK